MNVNDISNKRIIIFGTGASSKKFANENVSLKIEYFVDNNKDKHNKDFMGKKIYCLEKLLEENKNEIYILVASIFYDEISKQLEKMGFREIIHFSPAGMNFGDKYYCPCCNQSFENFLPFGMNQRLNAQCPYCLSLERHRLLWLYLQERTDICNGLYKVLHFAPEGCLQRNLKGLTNLAYTSADLNSPLAMIKMDITDISYPDHYFDIIICNHVLEHIPDDKKALRELVRVLKPGGWAILQAPIYKNLVKTFEDPNIVSPEDRERLFGQHDHVRRYGLDYQDRLKEAGFRVKVDEYVRSLKNEIIEKMRLNRNEDIYLCTKDI